MRSKTLGLVPCLVWMTWNAMAQNTLPSNGKVGIGTSSPVGTLTVASPAQDGQGTPAQGIVFTDTVSPGQEWTHAAIYTMGLSGWNGSLIFATDGNSTSDFGSNGENADRLRWNVGIGTSTPAAKLEVKGNVKVSGSGATLTFPDGTQQTTAYPGGIGASSPNQLSLPNGITIDQANANAGFLNNGAGSGNGIEFGAGSGEGIASSRSGANMYGLDFYTSFVQRMSITNNGNVGIHNSNPAGALDIAGVGGLLVSGTNLDSSNNQAAIPLAALRNSGRMLLGWNRSGYGGDIDLVAGGGGAGMGGFRFYDYTDAGTLNLLMAMPGNGNIGIGTDSPGAKLEVNGSIKLSGNITLQPVNGGANIVFPDSTRQSTAWNGATSGQDYADSVDVLGNRSEYEPGDVLVIDSDTDRTFRKAAEPYSRLVAGVYSTKPGLIGRRHAPGTATPEAEVPMAMAGIVPTKVSAENGPITRGDLLVASSTPGYAMKGTDTALLTGAVIGKALGILASGRGVIEALVALQ